MYAQIEYHALYGFDHFIVVDDCSTDASLNILRAYAQTGMLTLIPFGFYSDCGDGYTKDQYALIAKLSRLAKGMCEWIGFWDMDEYLGTSKAAFRLNLPAFIASNGDVAVFRLRRVLMSNHGLLVRDKTQLVVEAFHLGHANMHGAGLTPMMLNGIKTLIRRDGFVRWSSPHFPETLNVTVAFNVSNKDRDPKQTKYFDGRCWFPTLDLFLYHHRFLSLEEWMTGRASRFTNQVGHTNPFANDSFAKWAAGNSSEDCAPDVEFVVQSVVPKVHAALRKRWGNRALDFLLGSLHL